MSDNTRESFTGKASAALKVRLIICGKSEVNMGIPPQPDQQKSSTEQAGDTLTGKTDSAASKLQPDVRILITNMDIFANDIL